MYDDQFLKPSGHANIVIHVVKWCFFLQNLLIYCDFAKIHIKWTWSFSIFNYFFFNRNSPVNKILLPKKNWPNLTFLSLKSTFEHKITDINDYPSITFGIFKFYSGFPNSNLELHMFPSKCVMFPIKKKFLKRNYSRTCHF